MKKLLLLSMVMIGAMLLLQHPASADTASITSWQTTIEKLEISKDGGITWLTVFEGNSTPMEMIGQPAVPTGDGSVPAGHYNMARVHITYDRFVVQYDDGTHGASDVYFDGSNQYNEDTQDFNETDDISITVNADGTTSAYIDFDPNSSLTVSAVWNPALGGSGGYQLTDLDFNPVVSVHD